MVSRLEPGRGSTKTRHARGIVFDLDGTLIDSAPDITCALNQALPKHATRQLDIETVNRLTGKGPERLVRDALREVGVDADAQTVAEITADYLSLYSADPANRTVLFPHVREDIVDLFSAGYVLGICTNKPHDLSLSIIERLGMSDLFKSVIGTDAVPHPKPDPRHLLAVADELELTASEIAYVGDSETDRATADAARVLFFLVPWGGGRSIPSKGARRLTRLSDLSAYLQVGSKE